MEISGFDLECTAVLSGTAPGVDRLGERWANDNNRTILYFPADWDGLGKKAGHVRNRLMAENADALLAIWDGASNGTAGMISEARKRGLRVWVQRA